MPQVSFYSRPADQVAPDLLGRELICANCRGIIVETEAYLQDDPASHSFKGKTLRNASMYLKGGHAYVYRIYGVHNCFNVVTGGCGEGQAVLIRACIPSGGLEEMWQNRYNERMPPELCGERPGCFEKEEPRKDKRLRNLCNGPGKLASAFGISVKEHDGILLGSGVLSIQPGLPVNAHQICRSQRIGLTQGKGEKLLRRWFIGDNDGYFSRLAMPKRLHKAHSRNCE